ncbi:MAG: 23S rRNA (uracil(1939)-C(5))-methyltransferase RlmD [Prolixibacteraceae bacterium]|nr:23S rRNA (uracil(1939)-C(5))-methyltransferase RlmD [Prolixibacteraceae bacterium]
MITDIGAEGKSLAKINDMVVFTTQVIPGDVVDLQVVKKRRKYQVARVTKIHSSSVDKIKPFCEYFEICGGCSWQMLPYEKQLFYKQKQVTDQLTRIGKIELPEIKNIIGSDEVIFYRNKLEFTFSNKRWLTQEEINSKEEMDERNGLGFHVAGLFDKVINIRKCWLQADPSNKIRNFLYDFANKNNLEFFDLMEQKGFLRNVFIRTSSIGEIMVIMVFFYDDEEKRKQLLNALKNEVPDITSLVYIINKKGNSTINDQDIFIFSGKDHIWEEMEGLRFKIGPKSFYQTNSKQAYQLYKVARSFAGLTGKEVVYDLYTGTGTIANFVAKDAKKVIGIEFVPEAIEDAWNNSFINEIKNTSFFAGDMKDILTENFFSENGKPDVIITDPPRAGMHKDVIETLLKAEAQKIVYVSCNPATQARDILLLSEKYRVTQVQPVDMFPQTHHVENVVLMEFNG